MSATVDRQPLFAADVAADGTVGRLLVRAALTLAREPDPAVVFLLSPEDWYAAEAERGIVLVGSVLYVLGAGAAVPVLPVVSFRRGYGEVVTAVRRGWLDLEALW